MDPLMAMTTGRSHKLLPHKFYWREVFMGFSFKTFSFRSSDDVCFPLPKLDFKQTLVVVVSLLAFSFLCNLSAKALPPLGITVINPVSDGRGSVSVTNDTAYKRADGGIWEADASNILFKEFSHPTFGAATSVTKVVEGLDGHLYVATNFRFTIDTSAASIFRLDHPTVPLVTWENDLHGGNVFPIIVGIDRNQNGYGGIHTFVATRFDYDGTLTELEDPAPGASFVYGVSESGNVTGEAIIPGAIGGGPTIWNSDGLINFLNPNDQLTRSVADRIDGNGVNIGMTSGWGHFGEGNLTRILDTQEQIVDGDVLVSQSDFTIISPSFFGSIDTIFGFYPGLVAGKPDQALPIEEIFPELQSFDFDRISAPYAIDGHVFMVLSGNDGLILFGAADPSLIPEPATLFLAFIGALLLLVIFRHGRSRRTYKTSTTLG